MFAYVSYGITIGEAKSINVANEVKCIHSRCILVNKQYQFFRNYKSNACFVG